MRLLNVHTKKLEEFFDSAIPKYAILSHRWGSKEVTFQDINASDSQDWESTPVQPTGSGLLKIIYTCLQAEKERLEYVWVDTCCIDKTSSAELSEAINSMYAWYQGSDVCYAYLDDVRDAFLDDVGNAAYQAQFSNSKWFTRGWTLQELLAPSKLKFFGIDWKFLGDRMDLSILVSMRTNIPKEVIRNPSYMTSISIASRMSWASDRRTTRVEDEAYSLLGIFNVNMPLLYGEGNKAFIRLQEEILKGSDDQSIFAWEWIEKDPFGRVAPDEYSRFLGALADSPAKFKNSGNIIALPSTVEREPYTMTNKGLRIDIGLTGDKPPIAILECHYDNDFSGLLGIPLLATGIDSVYMRAHGELASSCQPSRAQLKTIYIAKNHPMMSSWSSYKTCMLDTESMSTYGFVVQEVAPIEFPFNWIEQTLKIPRGNGLETAAFTFRNNQWNHNLVVVFSLRRRGDKGFVKIVENLGEEPLQLLLERGVRFTELFTSHSMPLSPPRSSKNPNTTLTVDASVKKEIVFRREVFVLKVGISTNLI